uniref:Uncharacterized protein n=1 Tax=Bracon brevicornis TaxID=1563983 RepID=A0A6V7L5I1_9HYME
MKVRRERNDVGMYIPLRVEGFRLFYLIDKDGTWVNPELYDLTVGLDRRSEVERKQERYNPNK